MEESYSLSQKRHKESDCRQMIHDCKSQPYPSLFFYLFRIFPQFKLTEEKTGHKPSSRFPPPPSPQMIGFASGSR